MAGWRLARHSVGEQRRSCICRSGSSVATRGGWPPSHRGIYRCRCRRRCCCYRNRNKDNTRKEELQSTRCNARLAIPPPRRPLLVVVRRAAACGGGGSSSTSTPLLLVVLRLPVELAHFWRRRVHVPPVIGHNLPDGPAPRPHHHRVCRRAARREPNPVEEVSVGDARGSEEYFGAAAEVVRGVDAPRVEARGEEGGAVRLVARPEAALRCSSSSGASDFRTVWLLRRSTPLR